MNEYLNVIKYLLFLMLVLVVLSIPQFWVYSRYDIYSKSPMNLLSLGNMGGAEAICVQLPLDIEDTDLKLQCPSGELDLNAKGMDGNPILTFGIVDDSDLQVTACTNKIFSDAEQCSSYLNIDRLMQNLTAAQGQHYFFFDNISDPIYRLPVPNTRIQEECFGVGAQIFLQVGCTYKPEEQIHRQVQGLWIGCLCVSIALFLTLYTSFIEQRAQIKCKEWDVRTTTAADYTVEFEISEKFFAKFKEKYEADKIQQAQEANKEEFD